MKPYPDFLIFFPRRSPNILSVESSFSGAHLRENLVWMGSPRQGCLCIFYQYCFVATNPSIQTSGRREADAGVEAETQILYTDGYRPQSGLLCFLFHREKHFTCVWGFYTCPHLALSPLTLTFSTETQKDLCIYCNKTMDSDSLTLSV